MKKTPNRNKKIACPLCKSIHTKVVYEADALPLFQHKVFDSIGAAQKAKTGTVHLTVCQKCAFIFNGAFNDALMNYDKKYQNEQGNSEYFRDYLKSVLALVKRSVRKSGTIIEVGCGKGLFLELMRKEGLDVKGFDPTYEGKDKDIIKDYFSEKYSGIRADLIILRHTLEHIQSPFDFLKMIGRANNNKGKIFVEVPGFDWISKKGAFWDIFHEHCNYFTERSLASMFTRAKTGKLFNGQYIYVLADLADLKENVAKARTSIVEKETLGAESVPKRIESYREFLNGNKPIAIWGAGAKGSTFVNLLDRAHKKVRFVIDLNPKKQHKYMGGTGHLILPPAEGLKRLKGESILIMNENYLDEIKRDLAKRTGHKKIKIMSLGMLGDISKLTV